MKKGQEYTGEVLRMDFPNKGIVRIEEEGQSAEVAVKNALPGQHVRFVVNKKRGSHAEGRLKEVTEPAPCEGPEDACPHAGVCGGCLYRDFPYAETLKVKEGQIQKLLAEYTAGAVYEGIVESPLHDGYRNKMEYTFGDESLGGAAALGLHKRGSFYDILTVGDCRIAPADFGRILSYTLKFFSERGIPHYHRMKHTGILRHLLLRRSEDSGELLAGLVSTSELKDEALLSEWRDGLLALPLDGSFAGILHIVNDALADAVKCEGMSVLYGQESFTERILGLRFKVSTFSFFQTNSRGAEKLYALARDFLMSEGIGGTLFDLYSGTGTITQLLSPAVERAVGVEIVEEAVEAARENAKLNGITNCEFIAGDVLKVLDTVEGRPEVIVLDPPRDGVHPKALKKILDYGVDHMLYISCKPTSLLRDMAMIASAGYSVCRWGMVDMFPFSGNIEVCCLLERKSEEQ